MSLNNDPKILNNSLVDFISKKSNGIDPKISNKKNNIIRLNKKNNKLPSSNNLTLDTDEIIAKRNNFNKRTNSSIIRNIKIKNDFKRLNTHYENKSKLNKDYSNTNSINKSIRNIKKLQTTNYSEKKRKHKIKLINEVEPIEDTSNRNSEESNEKKSEKVNHIRNISSQNPQVLYKNKLNKQYTKDYVIEKIKREIKLSPSAKTKTNYNNFTAKTSKKIDFNDNASLNSSFFLKRKIKIIPMSHEYKERKLYNYNKKLKSELKDYKEYKEKYEEVIKENKKIQNKNNEITKRYIKLIQKLKEMKEKLQNNNNKNESEEKQEKKEKKEKKDKNKSRNNSAEKNRITNNFTIQSQLNIFMTEPNLGEKDRKEKEKEKEEIKDEKVSAKNDEKNNGKDIQEDKSKTENDDKKSMIVKKRRK